MTQSERKTVDNVVALAVSVMESDEIYDLLPGDGQDDFIVGTFTKLLKERARELYRSYPKVRKPLRWRSMATTTEAVKVFGEREVCQNNAAGDAEYKRRTLAMAARQKGMCALCGTPLGNDVTFDHEQGRGLGGAKRDDRIEVEGRWQNAAVHWKCNGEKGSRRVPYLPEIQTD